MSHTDRWTGRPGPYHEGVEAPHDQIDGQRPPVLQSARDLALWAPTVWLICTLGILLPIVGYNGTDRWLLPVSWASWIGLLSWRVRRAVKSRRLGNWVVVLAVVAVLPVLVLLAALSLIASGTNSW